jgi:hypothetical protein
MANKSPTRQGEEYRSFYLKATTWEAIKISRGYEGRGATSKFAAEINVARQYAADLVSNKVGCSSNVMRKVIALFGLDKPNAKGSHQCWCHLFDFDPLPEKVNYNSPKYNMAKFNGEVPYTQYSANAELRKNDMVVETKDYRNPEKKLQIPLDNVSG